MKIKAMTTLGTIEVEAKMFGKYLAVHTEMGDYVAVTASAIEVSKNTGWTVTHVPTGMVVITTERKDTAELAAGVLKSLTDWSVVSCGENLKPVGMPQDDLDLILKVRMVFLDWESGRE